MAHLKIIHFNDIYNVEPNSSREPVGGAARFLTVIKSFANLNPLILFSGDAFSPSIRKYIYIYIYVQHVKYHLCIKFCFVNQILIAFIVSVFFLLSISVILTVSTFTKGEQMIPVLNKIGTHCAVLGNHDFGEFVIVHYFTFSLCVCMCVANKYL